MSDYSALPPSSPPAGDGTERAVVLNLGPLDEEVSPKEGRPRPVERTRALLAYLLLALLGVVLLTLIGLLAAERLTVDEFNQVTGVAVTPIVGLLGAATGYYYGRGSR